MRRSIWDKWANHPFVPHSERFKAFMMEHNLRPVDPVPETPAKRSLPAENPEEDVAKKVCANLDPSFYIETAKITSVKVVDVKIPAATAIKKDTLLISLRSDMSYSALISNSAGC